MAFGSGGSIGTNASGTINQTATVLTTTQVVEVGELAAVLVSSDNHATTDADHSEVSGVVDSAGNTWDKYGEFTNGQGTIQTGATVSLWGKRLGIQLPSGGTVTASFTNASSRDATAISGWKFTVGNPVSVAALSTAVGDGADPAAIVISGLPSKEYLFLWAIGLEAQLSVTITQDADYTAITHAGQGSGAAGSCVGGGFRIFTGTGDTVDAATSLGRDHAQVFVALQEVGGTAYTLTAAQGSYTLSGQSVNLLFKRLLAAVQGSYSLSGQAANLLFGRKLAALQGSYVLSGQNANLLFGRLLAALQGSYTLSGQVANLLFGRLLAALQGSYSLTGQSADLIYSASTYTLVAAQGSYVLTGQSANLLFGRKLTAAQGSYALTGQDASLLFGRLLTALQGSYVLSGQSANLLAVRLLVASQGSYSLTGQSAGLLFGRKLVASQGSYILTGQAANLFFGRKLIALQGSYILSGQAAVLTFSGFVFVVTPDEERVFIVPSENRIITVASENRIFTV